MGVQSLQDETLNALGRMHSSKQVLKAYDCLRAHGCQNVNLDLMFAIPGQTFESWKQDLEAVIALEPEHISTYCLTFEEDTALWVRLNKGQTHRRTLEDEALFYEKTWDILKSAGFDQYEISNFGKPGHACQHNIDTWSMAEWIGYGPSAASQYRGQRLTNPHSIDHWLQGIDGGAPVFEETITLSPQLLAEDSLIFGLRMNQGVCLNTWRARFPEYAYNEKFIDLLSDFERKGLLTKDEGHLRLTKAGRLVADAVGEVFLGIFS
jgi:oxygen-independent coproporphyrinogen-3 oxidase